MTDVQLFPALDPATEAALRHSIRRWGVLVPIFVSAGPWQPGIILDGHHRNRIAEEEGCGPPSKIPIPVETEAEAHELAQTLNLDRRHLDVDQRRLIVKDLREAGFSLRDIAGAVGTSLGTIQRDLESGVSGDTPDEIHGRDGKTYPPTKPRPIDHAEPPNDFDWPEAEPTTQAEEIWTAEEEKLRAQLQEGRTVVANLRHHGQLVAWATANGLYERIDRNSRWGNPFVLPEDGDRQTVIANYAERYLPAKPSLLSKLSDLRGKLLGCWCAPEACHGDVLVDLVEGS